MSKQILYIDMDGVVADFDHEIKKVNPTIFEHEDGDYRGDVIDKICEDDVNIFERLQPIEGAIEAVEQLKQHYEIYFLSTPMWGVPQSFSDKRLWIAKHFGEFGKKRLILTHRKDLNMGAYLIDDRLKNGAAEFGGMHLHFRSEKFPTWESVLKFLMPDENGNMPKKFLKAKGALEFKEFMQRDLRKLPQSMQTTMFIDYIENVYDEFINEE